jgi:hypothetical protein
MARWFSLGCTLALFCSLTSLTGCSGSKDKPVSVSGTVDLDGKPLPEGTVTLVGEGGTAPTKFDVKEGKFEGMASPGKKRVEIRAFKIGKPTKMATEVIEATPENYIPAAYNTESKMTAEGGAGGGLNPSKFDVKSK